MLVYHYEAHRANSKVVLMHDCALPTWGYRTEYLEASMRPVRNESAGGDEVSRHSFRQHFDGGTARTRSHAEPRHVVTHPKNDLPARTDC